MNLKMFTNANRNRVYMIKNTGTPEGKRYTFLYGSIPCNHTEKGWKLLEKTESSIEDVVLKRKLIALTPSV